MAGSKITHPALYRAGQFFIALKAYLPPWAGGAQGDLPAADQTLVKSILSTPPQQQLFARMSPNDRRHAIAVACTLRQVGYSHPALMQAALLHDAGKSIGQPIIHRVLIVLFNAFWPTALDWLSSTQTINSQFTIHSVGWWRRPFVVHAQHPAIGAAWAQEAGCDSLAVSLIARHQGLIARHQAELGDESTEENELLAALQWADDLN